jgi:uncharacterized membrane protein YccC
MSDEKQLQRYIFVDGCSGCCGCYMTLDAAGDYYEVTDVDALLQDSTRVHTSILRGTIALTKAQAIHIAGLPADIEAQVQALHAELAAKEAALAEQIAITLSERARHEAHIKRLEVERGMLWDELTKVVGVERVHALSEAVLAARAQGEKP